MRSVLAIKLGLVIAVVVLGLLSCSEDSIVTDGDTQLPRAAMLYPTTGPGDPLDVSDSLDIYVGAADDKKLSGVAIWTILETREQPDLIATLSLPLRPDQVPETLQVADGLEVYRTRWHTRRIRNGTRARLFAVATDPAGNATRSSLVVVRVLNRGGTLTPPTPQILVTPPSGTVATFFTFDASTTRDSIDTPDDIVVRWDFDGDGIWDRTFAEDLRASVPVTFKYARAGLYNVKLEAKNTYLPDEIGRAARQIQVTNVGGDPVPPNPDDFILIPAGTYSVGTVNQAIAERDELPVHQARITAAYYIEKTEVTNTNYLEFLQKEMSGISPRVRREGLRLIFHPNVVEPVEEDSLPVMLADLNYSSLFYDPDGDTIAVPTAERRLPVVGVTWYGAKAYAESYGLRLPTEHEWEIAAKGTFAAYNYPWGETIDPEQANYVGNGLRRLRGVGSYPTWTSPFGLLDLSGNAAEWVRDWYDAYPQGEVLNPEGPFTGARRVIRGGSFLASAQGVRVTGRTAMSPSVASDQIGFRTAYTKP